MTREYDLFEKFPDGSSLWRASVSGLGNARLHLQELTRRSENQFYAIDMTAGKTPGCITSQKEPTASKEAGYRNTRFRKYCSPGPRPSRDA